MSNTALVELVSQKPTAKVLAATGAATGTTAITSSVVLLLGHFFGLPAPVSGAISVVITSAATLIGTYLAGYMKRNSAEDVIVK